MTVSLYSFVGMYDHALDTAAHLLTKGCEFAAANGVSEADMLGWKLTEDMHPLAFQLAIVINFSTSFTARAAGIDVPAAVTGAELDVAGFRAAIASAKAFLAGITPEQFAGRDDTTFSVKLGDVMEPTLPAGQWITGFATTNILFHTSIAYAILRMKGVQIGKIDLFSSGL